MYKRSNQMVKLRRGQISKEKLTPKSNLEKENPLSICWLVTILCRKKSKRNYTEIKLAICIDTSCLIMVAIWL